MTTMPNSSLLQKNLLHFLQTSRLVRVMLFFVFIVVLALLTMPPNRTVHNDLLEVGDVATRNIKAPRDFIIENAEETERNREKVRDSIHTVYDFNSEVGERVLTNVQSAFQLMRKILSSPPLPPEELPNAPSEPAINYSLVAIKTQEIRMARGEFEKIMGQHLTDSTFAFLEKDGFSQASEGLIIEILQTIFDNGVVADKPLLMEEQERGITLRVRGSEAESVEANLRRFYSLDQARAMVRIIGDPMMKGMPSVKINSIVEICQKLIYSNITLNRVETQTRVNAALREVMPVLYQIKAGEMLLREGERVTSFQKQKIQSVNQQIRNEDLLHKNTGSFFMGLLMILTAYMLYFRNILKQGRNPNKNLFFLTSVFVAVLLMAKGLQILTLPLITETSVLPSADNLLLAFPIPASAMIVCLFFGLAQAIPFAIVMGCLMGMILQTGLLLTIFFVLSCILGAYWVRDGRERKVFIKGGLKLGLFQTVLAMGVFIQIGKIDFELMVYIMMLAFTGGLLSGVLTSGIVPLLEILFNYTTDIKLLEIANLEQPLLKRMMLEAPGTYNHCMLVGTLAEAAAAEIGAHPLLARVGGYYHDIGKLSKPLYFIENQGGGKNPHDKLTPSMSALILISHVRDAVKMAKEYKLGEPITDIIAQHHGQGTIKYFYEKAKSLAPEGETIDIDAYRYPGPTPQTKEAAIVMLADIVEASSRTLPDPTPARIQGLVQKMINNVFSDGQLNECNITLKDLHKIAKSFNQVLSGLYHHRIEYAESAAPGGTKKKNASTDRKPTDTPAHRPESPDGKSDACLKRLGIS